jgi:hypothetical protein
MLTDTLATWRTELESELAEAATERDAALLEQSEAERAAAVSCAELAVAEAAIDTLARRIEAEQEIEAQGAVILRGTPPAISPALALRLDDHRIAGRAARTRSIRAGHTVEQANTRIADLRRGLEQLDLLGVADEGAAAA